ncbi:MAG: bifunctional heptose 7-phosphate kinase/heptose 1-phosphate adenyltransferase, partial [Elusimicrobiales bacterium]
STEFIIEINSYSTTEKTRIVAEHQQVVRVDNEQKLILSSSTKAKLRENIKKVIDDSDVIILSDYGKGIFSKDIIEFSISLSKKKNVAVFVDPKIEHFMAYRGATSLTPNLHEAFLGMRRIENADEKAVEKIGKEIINKLSLPSLIITRSEQGMSVFEKRLSSINITHIPTVAKEVFDVTGAGDTVISVVSLSYAVCGDILKSSIIANYAAGIVVSKIGAASVTISELKEAMK